jgi:hypothetical protein
MEENKNPQHCLPMLLKIKKWKRRSCKKFRTDKTYCYLIEKEIARILLLSNNNDSWKVYCMYIIENYDEEAVELKPALWILILPKN